MNRITFLIVIALCLIFAALNIGETYMYRTWVRATTEQRMIDEKLALADHVHALTGQLVRRMATDAQGDPAIYDILKRHFPASKAKTAPAKTSTSPSSHE